EAAKRLRLPSDVQAPVLAYVHDGLKEKCGHGVRILDLSGAERLDRAAKSLLSDVLGLGPVPQSSRGEQTQAIPESLERGFAVRNTRQVRRSRVTPPLR